MTDKTVDELKAELAAAEAKASHQEFPKWVEPHASHVVTKGDHVSSPAFPDFHVSRDDGKFSVLVHSAEEEAKALAAAVKEVL